MGRALPQKSMSFGVDFDAERPAEYTIPATQNPGDPEPPRPDPTEPPGDPQPPSIEMLEPVADAAVVLGATIRTRWSDESDVLGAVVRIFLEPEGKSGSAGRHPLGPAVGAALDGINDQLVVVVEGIPTGRYAVGAEIDDGTHKVVATAPGRIDVMANVDNVAPKLTIRSPSGLVELMSGEILTVQWDDEDPDDNATITFSLEPAGDAQLATGTFTVGPPIAEDPDGPRQDRASFVLTDVLPGLYDLVGTIDDGELVGTARVASAVRIRPQPDNDAPTLSLVGPGGDLAVEVGESFTVTWVDSDANDDARISLLLDPDTHSIDLDGDEVLLVASLREDPDGPGDQITLGVPLGLAAGTYGVVGVITDGVVQVVARAPGLLNVTVPEPTGGGGDGGPGQVRRISLAEPSAAVHTRLGGSIPVRLELTNIPANSEAKLFISGISHIGELLRVDVTPPGFSVNINSLISLSAAEQRIPNKWWPRRFSLEAEVVHDGVRYQATAAGAVWIRQEVEIRTVRMINYWCWEPTRSVPVDTDFFGAEIDWYGGGDGDEASGAAGPNPPMGIVQFWLTADGTVAEDAVNDRSHRLLFTASQSPNVVATTRVHYVDLVGIDLDDLGLPPSQLEPAVDDDHYFVTAVVTVPVFGRLVSTPVIEPIEVCFPLPFSDGGGP
jgi:hypothetical protein